jgi:hypothetical protein
MSDPSASAPKRSLSWTSLIHYAILAFLVVGGVAYWTFRSPTLNPMADPMAPQFDFGQTGQEVAAAAQTFAPNMIGDFIAPPWVIQFGRRVGTFDSDIYGGTVVAAPPGGKRLQIGQNNSPMPQDRVHMNWNFYNNAFQVPANGFRFRGQDIHQFMFGAEMTFLEGMASAEVRVPFTYGPGMEQLGFAVVDEQVEALQFLGRSDSADFGNVSVILKGLLYNDPMAGLAVSSGLGIQTPTAPGLRAANPGWLAVGAPQFADTLEIRNDTVNLSPFLAALFVPSDRLFTQTFVQFDVPTGSNQVRFAAPAVNGEAAVADRARLRQQSLLHLDFSVGYWLYRDPSLCCAAHARRTHCCDSRLSLMPLGLAFLFETHYTRALNDPGMVGFQDAFGRDIAAAGNPFGRIDLLTFTFGLTADFGHSTLTGAFIQPATRLNGGRFYDNQVAVQYNLLF